MPLPLGVRPFVEPGAPGNVGEPSEWVSAPQPDIQGLGLLGVRPPSLVLHCAHPCHMFCLPNCLLVLILETLFSFPEMSLTSPSPSARRSPQPSVSATSCFWFSVWVAGARARHSREGSQHFPPFSTLFMYLSGLPVSQQIP